ncbi:hypothetical protein GX441_03290 [bacterium]|nr:hypothetical protein [bacterium]
MLQLPQPFAAHKPSSHEQSVQSQALATEEDEIVAQFPHEQFTQLQSSQSHAPVSEQLHTEVQPSTQPFAAMRARVTAAFWLGAAYTGDITARITAITAKAAKSGLLFFILHFSLC